MPNYTTLLKTWGDTGAEYPTGYSYIEGEQPVDAWDNFLIHNVVKDLQGLIDTTNNDLLARSGGSLLSDLAVGGYAFNGDAGSVSFAGTEVTVDAPLDILNNLDVSGNISLTGTVDGVDVAGFESSYTTHAADNSAHHTRYADSEAVSAINAEASLSVDISGDANTLDGVDSTGFGRVYEGLQAPVFATTADVPSTIGTGELVYIQEDGKLYVEDGT